MLGIDDFVFLAMLTNSSEKSTLACTLLYALESVEINHRLSDSFQSEYDNGKEIGRGKFSIVYEVRHRKTGTRFAAKHIK